MAKQRQFTFTPGSRRGARTLTQLNNNLKQRYNDNVSKVLRPELNRLAKHEIELSQVIDMGAKLTADVQKMAAIVNNFYITADAKGVFLLDEDDKVIQRSFTSLQRATKSLFDQRFFKGKAFGHQDVTIAGTRIVGFIDALQELEESIIAVGVTRRRGKPYARKSAEDKLPVKGLSTLKAKTVGEVKQLKKNAQKMFLGLQKLGKLPTNKTLNPNIKWTNLAAEVNKIRDVQEFINTEKNKYYEVLKGQANIKLKIELENDNNFKSYYEKSFGRNISRMASKGTTEKLITKKFLDEINITGIKGSTPLEDAVVKDLATIAVGKKPKAQRFTSKKRTKVNTPTSKLPIFTTPTKLVSLQKEARQATKFVTGTRLVRTQKRESGGGVTQRELNKLRIQINRRLPAEVRRQMGRPALINRTGTFSNSVELTELRPGPKTVIGEYTYQLNPYETFENTGAREWPNGYNPKPLITKSIRNLALQYTKEKFTLRRE